MRVIQVPIGSFCRGGTGWCESCTSRRAYIIRLPAALTRREGQQGMISRSCPKIRAVQLKGLHAHVGVEVEVSYQCKCVGLSLRSCALPLRPAKQATHAGDLGRLLPFYMIP